MAGREPPLTVHINPQELARLKRELDAFEPALAKALRRRIREAGQDAVRAVKTTVLQPAPGASDGETTGARSAIARATRISTSFAPRSAGVKIITGGVRNGFSKAYNMGSFRHPVFGSGTWASQEGRPYFGSAITKSMRLELVLKVRQALDEGVRAIGGRIR